MQIKLLVEGGAMKPGPALSQKLGPAGIPINKVIEKVNEETKNFKGMKVPVELHVDTATKEFEIQVFSPPISELLKKEFGLEKASGAQKKFKVANASIEQIIKIAKTKLPNLLCKNLKTAVKTTVGSCASLGILVENAPATEVGRLIDEGKYDKEIENEITETPAEKRKELDEYFSKLKAEQDKIRKAEQKAEEEKKEKAKK
jgi:large subunit ribosomal protein L11